MQGNAVRARVATAMAAIAERGRLIADEEVSPLFVFHLAECGGLAELRATLGAAYAFCDDWSPSIELLDALASELVSAGRSGACGTEESDQKAVRRIAVAHANLLRSLCCSVGNQAGDTPWALACDGRCAAYAPYLHLLFPKARMLFLCRHPVDAYRSYIAQAEGVPVAGLGRSQGALLRAEAFADHWSSAMECVATEPEAAGLIVRHERLVAGAAVELEDYLGVCLPRPPSAADPATKCIEINGADDEVIARRAETQMKRLGFDCCARGGAGAVSPPRNDRGRCVVLVPVARYIEPLCDESLRELERRGYIVRRSYGCSAIDISRSRLATEALSERFEETMWIDADTAFDPDDVDRLRSHGLPLACGLLSRRRSRAGLAFVRAPGDESSVVLGEDGALLEILYAGAAFMFVRREVYVDVQRQMAMPVCNQSMGTPVVPFFMPMLEQRGAEFFYLSEDYSFCRRARISGYKLFADTTLRLGHIGEYVYAVEDAFEELPRYRTYRVAVSE